MNRSWVARLPDAWRRIVDGRTMLQRIVENTSWLVADRLLRMAVSLFVGVWTARYLGPSQYGLLRYATAFAGIFAAAAGLGLDTIVVRELVRAPDDRDPILGTAFVLKIAAAIAASGLAAAALAALASPDRLTRWLVAICMLGVVVQSLDVVELWFQSEVRSKHPTVAKLMAHLAASGATVLLIIVEAPLIAFALAALGNTVLGALGLVVVYRMDGRTFGAWRPSCDQAKRLLRDCWPLVFSDLAILLYMRIDQVMLGQMVSNEELGTYSVAVRLAEIWYFLPVVIASSTFPTIVEARQNNEERFYDRLQRLYNMMALLAYAVALPLTLLAGPIVRMLFGPSYANAGPMLAVLVWGGLFTFLGVARSSFLTAMNWTRVHFLTVLLGCVVNVALNLVLIPRYGGLGAAIASVVAYWAAAHGACFVYRPLVRTGVMLTKAMVFPRVW